MAVLSPSLPTLQTAVVTLPSGGLKITHDVPVPQLEPDTVLVRVEMAAINPVDVKGSDNFGMDGLVAGFDFSGTVVEVGERTTDSNKPPDFQPGDRVCGSIQGLNSLRPLDGAFSQYVAALADMVFKIPDAMSFEHAAALPVGVGTVALAMRALFSVSSQSERSGRVGGMDVLVYGASTATGTMALQYLKAMGHRPIATCSPSNFELVKSYGADTTFDYHAPDVAAEIRAHTKNRLKHVLDCISTAETMEFCFAAIGRTGGSYVCLEDYSRRVAKLRPTVRADWIFQPVLYGRAVAWPAPYAREADQRMISFGRRANQEARELLEQGKLRSHPVLLQQGGFEGVLTGADLLRRKLISGVKVVCRIPH